uniref:Uncharacterized protein n=1 Tax=Helianthus annuus TaxID=4232 RepID=A0A251T9H4_HELAN
MAMTKYVCCFFRIRTRLSCSISNCYIIKSPKNKVDSSKVATPGTFRSYEEISHKQLKTW